MANSLDLTLYGRGYCSLCDKMAAALAPLASALGLRVHPVDIEDDPELEARYGTVIPVLVPGLPGTDAAPLCVSRFDEAAVRAWAEIK